MSKHPFFGLFVDLLCEIIKISKVENDFNLAISIDILASRIEYFLDVLFDINLMKTIQSTHGLCNQKNNTKLKIDLEYVQLLYSLPLSSSEL